MKKIGKINLANKDLLSDGEMKRVLGGHSTSSSCKSGEFLFHCYLRLDASNYSDAKDMGVTCASNSSGAANAVSDALRYQDLGGSYTVSCG